MKRSVVSIILLITVLFTMFVPVAAEGNELDSFFEGKGLGARYNEATKMYEDTLEAPLTIGVKVSTDTDYTPEASTVYAEGTVSRFDFRAALSMSGIEKAFNDYVAALTEKSKAVDSLNVAGEFTITVDYDQGNQDMVVVPEKYTNNDKTLTGFDFGADTVYEEVSRDVKAMDNNKRATIVVKIKDGTKVADIKNTAKTSLHKDIVFDLNGVELKALNEDYRVTVNFTGYTQIGTVANIAFKTEGGNPSTATFKVYRPSSGGRKGGSSSKAEDEKFTVVFDVDGDVSAVAPIEVSKDGTVDFDKVTYPTKEGYVFDGYYLDSSFTKKAEGVVKITKNTTFYARWKKTEPSGELNTDDHFAYITGYPDGTVRPFNNITREEVATIFYRLLKAEKRNAIAATTNNFSDVEDSRWSNDAISTMTKGRYLVGYEDGTFRPESFITRAEFVTIVARFNDAVIKEGSPYTDIAGHWAESYIITAAKQGWLEGYSDGTFRPDVNITRADAIQIVNRLLVRSVDKDGISADATQFKDNAEGSKYYYDILEATNSHEFERAEGEYNEKWTKVLTENLIVDKTFAE